MKETNNFLKKIRTLRKSNHLLPLAIIFSLGLLPISYFVGGSLIFGGDYGAWFLTPLDSRFFVWGTILKNYNPTVVLSIPHLAFVSLMNTIGIPLYISEAFLFSLWFMGAGFSMYLLAISLSSKKSCLLGTAAAIFYMFNAFNMLTWSVPNPYFLPGYALYPLMFALFVRGIKSEKYVKNGIIFGLGSLVFVNGNLVVPFLIITLFTLLSYFIFYMVFIANRRGRINALRFASFAALIYLLVNIWWIMPCFFLIFEQGLTVLAVSDLRAWVDNYSSYTSILHLFQLYGWPDFGRPVFGWDATYVSNPFLVLLSFLPVILLGVALTLLVKIKKQNINEKKIFLFFSLFYLLSIFLAKGTHRPLGEVNWWLFQHVPGFVIFRSGFFKFGIMMALSLAFLFGSSLDIIYGYMEDKKFRLWRGDHFLRKFIAILLICLILIFGYPFFTGQVVLSKEVFYGSDIHHNIPQSYYEASSWINEQPEDFKILSLPPQGGWEVYDWGQGERYIGVGVLDDMIQKPIEHYLTGNPVVDFVYQRFQEGSIDGVEKLLGLLNVKYILLHNDANQFILGGENASCDRDQLISQKNIPLEKAFGKLEFYKIPDEYFTSLIYATNQYQLVTNTSSVYQSMSARYSNYKAEDVAFFLTDQLSSQQLRSLSNGLFNSSSTGSVSLAYEKVNPTKYVVHVNASQPFFLVLSESYDKDWVAYIDGQQVPDEYHFMANGFANAWYINKTGTYTVTLEFWPQKLFYIGSAISITTLILFTLYISRNKIKTIRRGYIKKAISDNTSAKNET